MRQASAFLDRAISLISGVSNAEQDALDNMPENLQQGERCEKMESAISLMDEAVEAIEEAKDKITDASG